MLVVFGSINVDLVYRVEKLPQPGETVICRNYQIFFGGKGANQAVAAAKAGGRVAMVGAVGDDDFGRQCRQNMEQAGVDCSDVWFLDPPTGSAAVWVDSRAENQIVVASGANANLKADLLKVDKYPKPSTLLLQMETPLDETFQVMKACKAAGWCTILNLAPARPIPEEALHHLNYLMVNRIELTMVAENLGLPAAGSDDLAAALAKTYDLTIVVTLGSQGVHLFDPKLGRAFCPALLVKPVDTTGAGDCFAGTFAAMLAETKDPLQALRWGVAASGLKCQQVGAQSGPDRATTQTYLDRLPHLTWQR